MLNLAFIIQARMTSTRLPGKVLKEILGRPMLGYQIERLRRVRTAPNIIVATTTNDTDLPIVDFCKKNDLVCFRGSEHDVLSRFLQAAKEHQVKNIIRITSDCPLIDPQILEQLIEAFGTGREFDYVSNTLERTFPRGMDAEIFSILRS